MVGLFTSEERADDHIALLNSIFANAVASHGADFEKVMQFVERTVDELPIKDRKALRDRLSLVLPATRQQ